jgi:hypothetical protein
VKTAPDALDRGAGGGAFAGGAGPSGERFAFAEALVILRGPTMLGTVATHKRTTLKAVSVS